MLITFMILGWLLCATLCAGISLAYFQREFPILMVSWYRKDLAMSWALSIFCGPAALVVMFFLSGFCEHGFMNPFVLDKYNKKD